MKDRLRTHPNIIKLIGVLAVIAALVLLIVVLFENGILMFNNPSSTDYPMRGIDVSSYQGDIDWPTLAQNNIDFAFIKATEGSSFVDDKFLTNWQQAKQTRLRIGAYHFFSFDSSAATQAQNFINTVPQEANSLPPVVDVEFYGDKANHTPAPQDVRSTLTELLGILKQHYGKDPIIYTLSETYDLYIRDYYPNSPIWIRDIFFSPKLTDGRNWTFWQYSNKGNLKGFNGTERFVDMNVFNGDREKFLHQL